MALILSKDLEIGFTADYWRISRIVIDNIFTTVELQLFKNKVSARNGKKHIDTIRIVLSESENPCTVSILNSGNPWKAIYNALKVRPEFNTSTDDLEDQ